MQRKYLGFFCYLFVQFKNRKKERDSALKAGCKEKRLFKGHYSLMEITRKRTPFQSKWCING